MFFRAIATTVSALLMVGLTSAGFATAQPPDVFPAAAIRLPFTLSLQGANGRSEVLAAIPEGSTPLRLTADVASNFNYPGTIDITVAGRRAAQVDATTGGPVTIALAPDDVVNGVIPIVMTVRLTSEEDCFADDNATATLTDARLAFQYPPVAATTVGAFLSPGVVRYTVAVPPNASANARSAALDAVSALTYRYSSPTGVALAVTADPPASTFLERTVIIAESPEPTDSATPDNAGGTASDPSNEISVADGTMTISGTGTGLVAAATALGSDNIALVQQPTVTAISAEPDFITRNDPVTLAELDVSSWRVEGIGRQARSISINQPAFGQTLQSLNLELVGAITQLPAGGQGRVDFLWNGQLLESQILSAATDLKQSLEIPANRLNRDNTLTMALSFVPPGGKCFPVGLGARVDIDVANSTVTPLAGDSVAPGFERFPQTLPADVPVSIATGEQADDALFQAALLVSALQSAGSQQFTYSVVDSEAMGSSTTSGVIVGGDADTATAYGAPLTTTTLTRLGGADPVFAANLATPFASLQAFSVEDRDLLLLSDFGSARPATELASALAGYANVAPLRWTKLEKQVVVLDTSENPITTDFRQPEPPNKTRTFLIATIIGFGVVALALLLWLWKRPRGDAPPAPGTAPA